MDAYPLGNKGGRAPTTGALGDAGVVAESVSNPNGLPFDRLRFPFIPFVKLMMASIGGNGDPPPIRIPTLKSVNEEKAVKCRYHLSVSIASGQIAIWG